MHLFIMDLAVIFRKASEDTVGDGGDGEYSEEKGRGGGGGGKAKEDTMKNEPPNKKKTQALKNTNNQR